MDKDKFSKGFGYTIGFIAQQVKEIIPEAISIHEDYIPNIMMVGTVEKNVNNANQYYITTTSNFTLERQKSDDTQIKSYSFIFTEIILKLRFGYSPQSCGSRSSSSIQS